MLIGFDFGGSLIKISILIEPTLKEKEEIINFIKEHITGRFHLENSKIEYINFIILKTNRQKFFKFLKKYCKCIKEKIIYGTGGGSRSFQKEIEKNLPNKIFSFKNEFLAIINGIKKFHLFFKDFVFKINPENNKKVYLNIKDQFPFLLTNLGTGISMNYVTETSSKYCSGTSLGGGTFIGFVKQFYPKISYKEIVGKIKNYIEEFGMDYQFENFLKDSFNKKIESKVEKCEDNEKYVMKLIYSFYLRILNNIALLSFNCAKIKKCDNIVFIGNFLKDHAFSKIILNNIINKLNSFHKVNKTPIFLEIDGFLGSFTCLGYEIKNSTITNL